MQAAEAARGEWPIDKKIGRLSTERHQSEFRFFCWRHLKSRKLLQQRETIVGYVTAGLEPAQFGFSRQRSYSAVAEGTAQQINLFQVITKPKTTDSFVGDVGLPIHL